MKNFKLFLWYSSMIVLNLLWNNLNPARELLACKLSIVETDSERFIAFEGRRHQSRRVGILRETTGFDNDFDGGENPIRPYRGEANVGQIKKKLSTIITSRRPFN